MRYGITKENTLVTFDVGKGLNVPMEGAICVFRKDRKFVLGYLRMHVDDGDYVIRGLSGAIIDKANFFNQFQYVLNENGGFLWVK